MNIYIGIGIILVIWNSIIIVKRKIKLSKEKVKTIKNFNLGSSHSLCAFASNLSNNTNLAENSQTFYYDYKVLNTYYDKIETGGICFLGISYFSFASKEYWLETDLFKYYKLLKIADFSGKAKIECLIYKYFPLIWSIYKKIKKERKIDEIKKYQGHVKKLRENRNLEWNLEIMNNIIKKCKEKSVKVILFTTPFEKEYNNYFDENLLANNFYKIIDKLKKEHDIIYLDFSKDYLNYNSNDFRDLDHLSKLGSQKFLEQMKKELKKKDVYI